MPHKVRVYLRGYQGKIVYVKTFWVTIAEEGKIQKALDEIVEKYDKGFSQYDPTEEL